MGTKRDIIDSDIDEGEKLDENIHSDRRKHRKKKFKEVEHRLKISKKVPVWVKKEVLDYEEELRILQI